ncbi:hypothetical protein GO599_04480 [Sulfolobus islandicus]|uniref:Uncharacterized protein n=1 Tax=Saccharolobus islandicus (strain HVE10/4) TaxID=930943 RepID=F0NJI4_SACI0|nr:hypothetical protein [Sulfolobus islandicus]ADX81849.1 hypothetical protein SiH_0484 [Sulfolobus islandicus HVE10/4]WCM36799.1 hypothetical protein GO599_04480 [Sulfolobus islandicus]
MRMLLYVSIIALLLTIISLSMFTPAFDLSFYTSDIYITSNIINIQKQITSNITLVKINIQPSYLNDYVKCVYIIVYGSSNYYNLTGNYAVTANELIEEGNQPFFQFSVSNLNNLKIFIVILYNGGGEGILSYYI